MLNNFRKIVFTCLIGVLLYGCAGKQNPAPLTVNGGEPVIYQSDSGDRIVARYYSLSDSTLDFVKVTLPGGKEYTLPQVLSASGVRYTNDMELVWWKKGIAAFAEARVDNGQWVTKYNCKEILRGK